MMSQDLDSRFRQFGQYPAGGSTLRSHFTQTLRWFRLFLFSSQFDRAATLTIRHESEYKPYPRELLGQRSLLRSIPSGNRRRSPRKKCQNYEHKDEGLITGV